MPEPVYILPAMHTSCSVDWKNTLRPCRVLSPLPAFVFPRRFSSSSSTVGSRLVAEREGCSGAELLRQDREHRHSRVLTVSQALLTRIITSSELPKTVSRLGGMIPFSPPSDWRLIDSRDLQGVADEVWGLKLHRPTWLWPSPPGHIP